MDGPDVLVVGAGPVGCVVAERCASQLGWRSLVIDRRAHLAGNCYDHSENAGILVHAYGPHYFRTDRQALLDYLSAFTEWIPGNYIVKSSVRGELFPFPINRQTLEQFFHLSLDTDGARALLERLRVPIEHPQNAEELVLSRVGRELYEAFYLGYTLKQWGRHPRELAASVCGRVPVRYDNDERYVDQRFQLMPAQGFSRLFAKMLSHPLIEVRTQTDYAEVAAQVRPRRATVYCGAIDEFFQYRLGRLPWRSLRFDFRLFDEPQRQPCVQINHPNEFEYTRTVEFKHVTGQVHPQTVVSYEYPAEQGEPYYPVPSGSSAQLYRRYRELADEETRRRRIFFCGRLANYTYVNTDQAIEMALELFERLRALPPASP